MKILLTIILFIVHLSYVCTSKIEDTSLNHFDVVISGVTESENILDYQAKAERYHTGEPLIDALLFFPVTIAIFVAITTVIFMVIIVALVALVVSSVGSASTEGIILGRSFAQQLFKISHTLIDQEKLDSLTEVVEKSIEVVTKLYH